MYFSDDQILYSSRYVLTVSMGMLSIAHIHRQITDYGGYTLDFTGYDNNVIDQLLYKRMVVQWRIQGRGLRDPPLFLDQTETWRAEKVFFKPPPPYLKVWIVHRSGL